MLLNIFHSGGLWAIPLVLFLAACASFYKCYLQDKSGYVRQDTDPTSSTYGDDLPTEGQFYKTGSFVFGCIFLVASIVTFLAINSDYKGV